MAVESLHDDFVVLADGQVLEDDLNRRRVTRFNNPLPDLVELIWSLSLYLVDVDAPHLDPRVRVHRDGKVGELSVFDQITSGLGIAVEI